MPAATPSQISEPFVLPLPRLAGRPRVRAGAAAGGQRAEHSFSAEQVSRLLWHGLGLNRRGSGGRAAASAGQRRDLEVYVCLPDGGYRYDAPDHALHRVTPHDHRPLAGCDASGPAPALSLVYVVCGGPDEETGWEECGRLPDADPASVAGSVAAYCAKAGLHARGEEWFAPHLGTLLGLAPGRRVALTQTVRAGAGRH